MAVATVLRGLGSWNVTLREDTPKAVLDSLRYFGHITIQTGRVDPRVAGDSLLRSSRYTGVYRARKDRPDGQTDISGVGMAVWLGDEDGKGAVIETLTTLTNEPFHTALPQLLPDSVQPGTIFNIGENFTGAFQYVSPRQAIDYICQTMGAAWRVNGDGTLDAGEEADLYVTDPKVIVARNQAGRDLRRRALLGQLSTDQDVEDFTTRVLLLASDAAGSYATGDADILPGLNIYNDLFGNPVEMTRLVSETGTSSGNADARAQLQLNRFTGTRDSLDLSSSEYDIPGDIEVGDYLWVWDPEKNILDYANEVYAPWGELINPMKLQLTEVAWPIDNTMSVCFRDHEGSWVDLTDYFMPETGSTGIVVGGYSRSLTSGDGGAATQPPPPEVNLTIPDVVPWVESDFLQSVYQSDSGETKAQAELVWLQPDNTDSSNMVDGDHYEIRYRSSKIPLFPVTHAQMAVYTHQQLADNGGTWGQPIQYPLGEWQYLFVPFDKLRAIIYELTPSMPYEAQIRAVDTGSFTSPANAGAWSASTYFQAAADTLPPATPAPAEVAASLIAIQVKHFLGRAEGGIFNLDADLNHLEVHGANEPNFTPSSDTIIGKLQATYGMINGEIPAVGTFQVSDLVPVFFKVIAVDVAGNKSLPSTAVGETADLIDDSHITNLTVSKVTAGTITATWLMAGLIRTAISGARSEIDINGLRLYNSTSFNTVNLNSSGSFSLKSSPSGSRMEIDSSGFRLYNPSGANTVNLKSSDGTAVMTGTLQSGLSSDPQRIVINPTPTDLARIDLYDDGSIDHITLVNFGGNFIMQRESNSTRTNNGGRIFFTSGSAHFGYANVTLESYIRFDNTDAIRLKGHFAKTETMSGRSALYCDKIGGSGTSTIVSYGATMVGQMLPFVEIMPTSGGTTTPVVGGTGTVTKSHVISASSLTGFTVAYSSGNCDIWIWAARAY